MYFDQISTHFLPSNFSSIIITTTQTSDTYFSPTTNFGKKKQKPMSIFFFNWSSNHQRQVLHSKQLIDEGHQGETLLAFTGGIHSHLAK